MEAIEFLQEYKRMCRSVGCTQCPMHPCNNKQNMACSCFLRTFSEESVEIVEQWSKEHPLVTNRMGNP